jgi:DNA-binding MarR family transcriptional regulator
MTTPPTTEAGTDVDGFDHLIHAPARLRICAALDHAREIEFATLMTLLGTSKSALSKHLSALTGAGYLTQRRATRDTRQRLWLRLTPTGRAAYHRHVTALHQIVGDVPGQHPREPAPTPPAAT